MNKEHLESEFTKTLINRYSTSIYQKLKNARVAIAGLGGLGSNVAVNLTRAGIGNLHLIDFDKVELSNLNRQYYFIEHLGMYKTEAIKKVLKKINPYTNIKTSCIKLNNNNITKVLNNERIICEAFDKAKSKAMLVNTLINKIPNCTIIAGSGMAGYENANNITTKQFGKRLFVCGDGKTDISDGAGLMSPRVAACAGHQSNKILELILK